MLSKLRWALAPPAHVALSLSRVVMPIFPTVIPTGADRFARESISGAEGPCVFPPPWRNPVPASIMIAVQCP